MTKGRLGVGSHILHLHTADQTHIIRMVPQLTLDLVSAGLPSSLAAHLLAKACSTVLVNWCGGVDTIHSDLLDLLRIPEFCSREAIRHSYSSERQQRSHTGPCQCAETVASQTWSVYLPLDSKTWGFHWSPRPPVHDLLVGTRSARLDVVTPGEIAGRLYRGA